MPKSGKALPGFQKLLESANQGAAVSGVNSALAARLADNARGFLNRPLLIITASSAEAEEVLLNFRAFSEKNSALFGAQTWHGEKELENISVSLERLECYTGLLRRELDCVVSPILALLQDTPDPKTFLRRKLTIKKDSEYPPEKLARDLIELGFERADMVEFRGEFCLRGGLVDIFPLTEEHPWRLEYFGDTVESFRRFDPATQRSFPEDCPQEISIFSANEHLLANSKSENSLLDYYAEKPLIVWYEFGRILKEFESYCQSDILKEFLPNALQRMQKLRAKNLQAGSLYLCEFSSDLPVLQPENILESGAQNFSIPISKNFNPERDGLKPFDYFVKVLSELLESWQKDGWKITIHCGTEADAKRLKDLLPKETFKTKIGSISRGFLLPALKEAVISDDELFQRAVKRRHKTRTKVRPSEPIDNLATIETGAYVVHLNYGIGRYEGIQKIKDGDTWTEMITIRYANDDLLYVSLGQAALVERYVSVGNREPELDSLGSPRWKKRCQKAEKAVIDLASELLERQAQRKAQPGFAALPDSDWQIGFEKAFPFAETKDQEKAIADIKADMEAPSAMDRLVCGDVGFGKTEVAIRAAFKTVMSGRQVAVLVPTTILAHQHLSTFHDRMAHYPIRVEELSRFVPAKRQKEIVKDLADGKIDVIIGTHRLLSKDIKIPRLGLIIIDEEQRFGVVHKERLKKLSHLTDVLTLSATPIPRTLYQSLTGLRDMSVIMTPPQERLPVTTTLIKKSGPVIKDAVMREIARGGQIFYLHNRVETIEEEFDRLQKLLPNARIAIAHGQMKEDDLELVIKDFLDGKYDILLCTMIVESGIDMPNVNTMIIDDAWRFGLADLYQLRGRVGRSTRQAYCYLILPHALPLDSLARHRLRAIMENTQLGSGYQIAMKDLELRGAGNILGAQQSGHIAAIGFGLYCKLLYRAIQLVKSGKYIPPKDEYYYDEEQKESKPKKFDWRKELPRLSPTADEVTLYLPITGDIPETYVQSPVLRLDLFRRFSAVRTMQELNNLKEEIEDRFGKLPHSVATQIELTEIKIRARARGIDAIEAHDGVLLLRRQGKIYNPFGKFPKINFQKANEAILSILAFLARIQPLPGTEE